MFRAKLRDALKKTALCAQVEQCVWRKDWVVHSEPVGSGAQAFQYLAPYIFRVALSNNRLRNWSRAKSLSLSKSRPLINLSTAPSPPPSSSVASSNTSSLLASSKCATSDCAVPVIVIFFRTPDICSLPPPAN
ncbi:MAG: transposase [Pyrinomonadaceae bacterium]|nr:transposase [Pyrinomonadaceae bacterium]